MTCRKQKYYKGSWMSSMVQAQAGFMQDTYPLWTSQMTNQLRDNLITPKKFSRTEGILSLQSLLKLLCLGFRVSGLGFRV